MSVEAYHARRAEEERQAAATATFDKIRREHLESARRYQEMADIERSTRQYAIKGMLSDAEIERIWAGESPIRVLREKRGLSVGDLSLHTGLTADQLEWYEKARRIPQKDRLLVIAEALGVRASDLRACHKNFESCARLLRHVENLEVSPPKGDAAMHQHETESSRQVL